ncbi:MAG: hypothetical protein PHU93_01020 [Candidatus Gracilibacteria bacterium]|nr:hypothetical protein [Candidatus Gracilibacteria bacterium]
MANIEFSGVPTEKTKLAMVLAQEGLKNIAETLANDSNTIFAGIHEIHIMRQENEHWDPVFSYTEGGREVEIFDVWDLISRVRVVKHGSIVSLEGQEGQSFDFMVMILHKSTEYFIFGNNLYGTLEDLEQNEEWLIAKSQFVTLAAALAKAISGDD